MVCGCYLDLKTTSVIEVPIYPLLDSDMGIWGLRSLVFLCSELIQQLLSPFLAPECC